ncbi:MAG: alpha/beta fold hydrolase, partial [Polyangiaceae bacterium]
MNEVYEIRPARPGRRSDLHEQIVAVHDGGMCLRFAGIGSPTVIFDSAIGKGRDAWNAVFSVLAQTTRVCAYDRKGIGGSTTPQMRPHSSRQMADDLYELLQHAGIPGPYVLVGHSIGGINVRLFASAHPDLVAGMVLVDAAGDPRSLWDLMPDDAQAKRRRDLRRGPEGLDWDSFVQGAVAARLECISIENKPLAVISRGLADAPPGAAPDTEAAWLHAWNAQQAELLTLSTNAV